MARVTVEDCIDKVNNRFELVLLAAQRARALSRGEECRVERDRDKNTVVSLREIAGEQISPQSLRDVFLRSFTPAVPEMEKDDEQTDLIPTEQNIFGLQDISAEEEAAHLYGEERGTARDEHSSSED